MKIISLVPSRGSRASDHHGSKYAGGSKKSRPHPTMPSHSLMDDDDDDDDDVEDRYAEADGRHSRKSIRDMDEREGPSPSPGKRRSGKKEHKHADPPGFNDYSKRRSAKHEQDYSRTRPSSERIFRGEHVERQGYSHGRPTSARSLPVGGPRQYPKERWVPNPPPGDDCDEDAVSLASSADDFLQSYARYGKYQVDRFSMVEPKLLDYNTDERYGARSPGLFNDSSDSDSGIARWRSEDEEDEDNSQPDWDMAMYRRTHHVPAVAPATRQEDDATLSSVELVNFDGSKVQVLTDDFLLSQRSNSLTEGPAPYNNRVSPSRKRGAKKDKKGKSKREPIPFNSPDESLHSKPKQRSSKIEINRTLSTMSNSVEKKSSRPKEHVNRKKEGDAERVLPVKSKSGRPKKKSSIPPKRYEDEEESLSESEEEHEDSTCDSQSSSGSLPSRAQMEFRRKKREEHLRWLQHRSLRGKTPEPNDQNYSDSDLSSDCRRLAKSEHNSEKGSSNVGLFGRFRRGKAKNETSQTNREFKLNDAPAEPAPEPLPWEQTEKKKGFFQRAAAMITPEKEKVKSVDDLPFPNSDSYDGSLVGQTDKYKDILEELPVLSPSAATRKPKPVHLSTATVSSMSHTLPDRKKPPLWRAKKGLGNQLKSIFLKPF